MAVSIVNELLNGKNRALNMIYGRMLLEKSLIFMKYFLPFLVWPMAVLGFVFSPVSGHKLAIIINLI